SHTVSEVATDHHQTSLHNSQPFIQGEIMHCTRCAGLRVQEILYEGGIRVLALRCIHCGDITDRMIVLNRQRPPYPKPHLSRTPIYGSDRWKKKRPMMA